MVPVHPAMEAVVTATPVKDLVKEVMAADPMDHKADTDHRVCQVVTTEAAEAAMVAMARARMVVMDQRRVMENMEADMDHRAVVVDIKVVAAEVPTI